MDYQRLDVEFQSGTETCRAWLYRPLDREGARTPCIVMAHGLGGTRDAGLEPYAQKFAHAGYLVLLFDYRHFGDSDGQPRQLFSVSRQLADWSAAIKYARSLEAVDESRVALWGTSFSGGHVIVAAARDGRVAAVAAQCPMMDALAASLNVVRYGGVGTFLKLGAAGMVDQLRAMFRLAPFYIPLIASHGALAAMSSRDSVSGYREIVPSHWQNRICARYVLTVAAYRPIAYAGSLRCPALIQVCMHDSLAPPGAAIATARKIGASAELKQVECGHFDIYVGRYFERASDEQLAFFNRVLSKRERS